ncbi:MAG: dihydroneopterin aldolase [Rikenellaceae bacterium]
MREIIEIEKMEFYAFHGCFEAEKRVGNRFEVYLRVECDASKAVESDMVGDTVNYVTLFECVKCEMEKTHNILESVAANTLRSIAQNFPTIERCKIKISKLNPPLGGVVDKVSVTMEL